MDFVKIVEAIMKKLFKKIICYLVIITIISNFLFVVFNYDHNCNDDECNICLIINSYNNNKFVLSNNSFIMIINLLQVILFLSYIYKLFIDKSKDTLVGLKVQLNEDFVSF